MTLRTTTADSSALHWTKSSRSSNDGPECVEVAAAADTVFVRDSKDTDRPGLAVSRSGWAAFTAYAAGAGDTRA
ncbi:DUF397 domain-containing protein [Streptomyces sp. TR06-5]|uniref:DUF397 domain-containing protein n=1 Tax=unclassified Streptomyces TaxID=2593676 RepID=UPI00399F2785